MKKIAILVSILSLAQTLSSCLPMEPLGNLDHSALEAKSNSMAAEVSGGQQLFTREEETQIAPDQSLYNGSLIGEDQQQANFLVQNKSLGIGSYIDILVIAKPMQNEAIDVAKNGNMNSKPKSESETDSVATAAGEGQENREDNLGNAEGVAKKDNSQDAELAKMLLGLPELVQENSDIIPIKSFRAKVIGKRPNGDVVLEYQRSSLQTAEQKGVLIRAVLAAKHTLNPDEYTTERLQDIKWQESENGFVTFRESPEWQNEYTLRLSGFDEAKSLAAMDLEKKRQQVLGLRDGVKNQINNVRKEKQTFAKEREALLKKQSEQEKLIAELKTKVAEAEPAEGSGAELTDAKTDTKTSAKEVPAKNSKNNAEALNGKL